MSYAFCRHTTSRFGPLRREGTESQSSGKMLMQKPVPSLPLFSNTESSMVTTTRNVRCFTKKEKLKKASKTKKGSKAKKTKKNTKKQKKKQKNPPEGESRSKACTNQ